nr:hypothetical protein [Nocardioidaceae bacterium]
PGSMLRYPETLSARYTRGGCPVYDEDATWAFSTALPIINGAVAAGVERSGLRNVALLDISTVLDGHRLCETGVSQVAQGGRPSWQQPGASGRLEWVNRLSLGRQPWGVEESWHPNHWGVAAIRGCILQAIRGEPLALARCTSARDKLHVRWVR